MTVTPSTLNNGRYQIEAELGVGGMASVLLATDTRLGVYRAIKLLNSALSSNAGVRERLKNEAFAQASLQHPNILMVHDVIEDEDGIYLVMEVADRGNLRQQVMTQGPLAPRAAVEAMITICAALGAAHQKGLIHRDIKPDNILIGDHNTLKVADFGIARVVARDSNLTQTGMVMGTWAYMPPEQRESAHEVDNRADIYALGVTLYFLLSARNPSSLHNRETHPSAFAHFPPALAAIIQRATRFDPDERYANCEALIEDLRAILPQLGERPLFRLGTDADGPLLSGKLIPTDAGLANRTVVPDPRDMTAAEVLVAATHLPTDLPPLIPNHTEPGTQGSSGTALTLPPIDSLSSRFLTLVAVGVATASALFVAVLLGVFVLPKLLTPEPTEPTPDPIVITTPPADPPPTEVPPAEVPPAEVPPAEVPPAEVPPAEVATQKDPPPTQKDPPPTQKDPPPSAGTGSGSDGGPRVIRVISTGGSGSEGPGETNDTPTSSDGRLVLRTIPSGATVQEKGRLLSSSGGGVYMLSPGSHVLSVTSPSGESTTLPVTIRAGGTTEVCYDFDTNQKCSGTP